MEGASPIGLPPAGPVCVDIIWAQVIRPILHNLGFVALFLPHLPRSAFSRHKEIMKFLKPIELYNESLKTKGPLMGISVGVKQFGLSLSDASKKEASPDTTMPKTSSSLLPNFISRYAVSALVVGYPFERNQSSPNVWWESKLFVDQLLATRKFEGVNYTFWDETCTMKWKFHSLNKFAKPIKPAVPYAISEEHAAFDILQGYLDFFNKRVDQTLYQEFGQPKSSGNLPGGSKET